MIVKTQQCYSLKCLNALLSCVTQSYKRRASDVWGFFFLLCDSLQIFFSFKSHKGNNVTRFCISCLVVKGQFLTRAAWTEGQLRSYIDSHILNLHHLHVPLYQQTSLAAGRAGHISACFQSNIWAAERILDSGWTLFCWASFFLKLVKLISHKRQNRQWAAGHWRPWWSLSLQCCEYKKRRNFSNVQSLFVRLIIWEETDFKTF